MHAMGNRLLGSRGSCSTTSWEVEAETFDAMASTYPHIYELFLAVSDDDTSNVGPGCDDQFEFALDPPLAGLERLKQSSETPD
jgi:hypothetical protein